MKKENQVNLSLQVIVALIEDCNARVGNSAAMLKVLARVTRYWLRTASQAITASLIRGEGL